MYLCINYIYIYIYQGCDTSSNWRIFSTNGKIMDIRKFHFKKIVKNKTKMLCLDGACTHTYKSVL